MTKLSIFLIGFLLVLASCTFNSNSSGSIRIDTTTDSLALVFKNVQVIVNDMDHDEIKQKVSNQSPDFSKASIKNSYMKYGKMWDPRNKDGEANIYVRVTLNCSPFKSEEAMKVIELYESYIIDELKKNNISVVL